jgi:hypothetical protein
MRPQGAIDAVDAGAREGRVYGDVIPFISRQR